MSHINITKNNHTDAEPGAIFLNHTASEVAKNSLLYIQHVGHHCFKGNNLYCDRVEFKSIHLVFTLDGKGHLNFRNMNHDVAKGQVMLINCFEHHIMYSNPELGWHYKWIHFDGFNSTSLHDIIYDKFGPVIDFGNDQYIPQNIDSLIEMVLTRDINIEIKASNTINNILTYILLNGNSRLNHSSAVNYKIKSVLDFIEKNYSTNIKYDDLIKIGCYSKYHLSRLFKAVTGYNPHEYIIKYRINAAKGFLTSTGMTIDEIARSVGYENTGNFITTFKRLENVTPLKFRKAQVY